MSAISDFCAEIRGWLGRDEIDYNDSIVTSWVRMAEQRLSDDLQIADMVKVSSALIADHRVELPDDWISLDFVRATDKFPLKFITRDQMYSPERGVPLYDKYTITGNYLVVGNVNLVDGTPLEISYFSRVPEMTTDETWLLQKHRFLYVATTLIFACAYGVEDNRAQTWEAYVTSQADKLNAAAKRASTSGSPLNFRPRK